MLRWHPKACAVTSPQHEARHIVDELFRLRIGIRKFRTVSVVGIHMPHMITEDIGVQFHVEGGDVFSAVVVVVLHVFELLLHLEFLSQFPCSFLFRLLAFSGFGWKAFTREWCRTSFSMRASTRS